MLVSNILKQSWTTNIRRFVSYSVSVNANVVTEGTSVLFRITTRNLKSGTILYYSLDNVVGGTINSNDVGSGSAFGSVTIYNNLGLINIRFELDQITEGTEIVNFRLRSGSATGSILASTQIAVLDTSRAPSFIMEYLVVGGGGAGGAIGGGGGGGGGGFAAGSFTAYNTGVYSIVVGAGGAAPGGSGSDSRFATIISKGGGGGGDLLNPGQDGASGGGSGVLGQIGGVSIMIPEGNSGWGSSSSCWAGGGGGAGAVATGKNGADGRISTITGVNIFYSGGGGGGAVCDNESGGTGGQGGGGVGGGGRLLCGISIPTSGLANRGGGGGGAGSLECGHRAGNGGSGVVILRIPSNRVANFSSGVSFTSAALASNFTVYTITGTATPFETVSFI
jgi:hypothetical protein